LIRVRLDTAKANPNLVAAYINSPRGREYMLGNKKQMTGQANVNAKTLRNLPVALPSIEVQGLIVDRLREMESRLAVARRIQTEVVKEMDALLPAILNRAFQGTL
jgi:type I restriction enzyme S subunit